MSGIIITALVILAFIVVYQIASTNDITTDLRNPGVEGPAGNEKTNKLMAWLMGAVFILGMLGIWYCDYYMRPMMLPVSASEQGVRIDWESNLTLGILALAFFITQFLLFYFVFRFWGKTSRTAHYYPHNNRMEIMWTTIPAMVLALLIIMGLKDWFHITGPAPKNSEVVEIVGKQFNWIIHYPGPDGILGKRDFRKIDDAHNIIGLDFDDPASHDDIIIENGEMHLMVDKPVNIVINSRDVIHDVGLPHFRLKMDAVPGIPTRLWMTPSVTSKDMIKKTGNPNFVYEIVCDQLCGKGHYSMRGTIVVETPKEFKAWLQSKTPYYVLQQESSAPTEEENQQNVGSVEVSQQSNSTEKNLSFAR